MLRRAAARSRGLHPGTCGHWRATSRCVALSYSAYRPPRNSATTVYQPHNGQTVRVVPINRPEPRSVEDIVKYGVLSSEEERAALDNRRKVRMFVELARVHYDKPRMKVMLAHPNPNPNPNPKPKPKPKQVMLAWYERDRPSASSLEHHHLLRAYAKCQLGDRAAAHIARMRDDGCAPDEGHCNLAVLV